MNEQELFMQAQMLEQELQRVAQHRKAIEEELQQTELFNAQMKQLPTAKDKTLLAPLGRGVFVKSAMKDSKMLVQVGAGFVVEREMKDVTELMARNVMQLKNAFMQLQTQEEFYVNQMQSLLVQAQSLKKE
ncbi:MAG TPA: prefoldin subunit alpha [Candidatus Nanoarchaeia archaeon]|nr:prefoldin subunit alpha [Candidatus Nanoarchaeia archaeon]